VRYGIHQTRWRLQDLAATVAWLADCSRPTIHNVLKRLGFGRKQVLRFVRSPDPDYDAKWRAILRAFTQALERPGEVELLFLDEFTYYRLPEKAPVYHDRGPTQPRIPGSARANTKTRIVATLNGYSGHVLYLQRSLVGEQALCAFYPQVRTAYPTAKTILVVQDNWPTHKLPAVLQTLAAHHLTPLFLPTYASWLNPIEKLWRWLRQTVLHAHPLADDLPTLRQQVCTFLDQFDAPSDSLLHYVGLLSV
jgi:hypothetical protein